jgi:hypothetical protein
MKFQDADVRFSVTMLAGLYFSAIKIETLPPLQRENAMIFLDGRRVGQ